MENFLNELIYIVRTLRRIRADHETILAALLNYSEIDLSYVENIKLEFGENVANLFLLIKEMSRIIYLAKNNQDNKVNKMILSIINDKRAIQANIVCKLVNVKFSNCKSCDKSKIFKEILNIHIPICTDIGFYEIKSELEDLWLKYMEPLIYQNIKRKLYLKKQKRKEYIEMVIKTLKKELKNNFINSKINGRAKNFYSIYKKMFLKHKNMSEVNDLLGFRIIVEKISDCYLALEIVHKISIPLPNRFKDYIFNPKRNGYQSLHTTINILDLTCEIQIKTQKMFNNSNSSSFSHTYYKKFGSNFPKETLLLNSGISNQKSSHLDNSSTKCNLYKKIYVFTYQFNIIELDAGSSVRDYVAIAYQRSLQNRIYLCKINDKIEDSNYILKNGDIVNIFFKSINLKTKSLFQKKKKKKKKYKRCSSKISN